MKKKIYYWSPCLTNIGTVKSTLNSAISLAKFSNIYEVKILNVFGEWDNFDFSNIDVIKLVTKRKIIKKEF